MDSAWVGLKRAVTGGSAGRASPSRQGHILCGEPALLSTSDRRRDSPTHPLLGASTPLSGM